MVVSPTSDATEVKAIFIIITVFISFDVFKGCLKIHMVDFDCKMGHGSNQNQLKYVVILISYISPSKQQRNIVAAMY